MFYHRAFGLIISSDQPLPGLPPVDLPVTPFINVYFDQRPPATAGAWQEPPLFISPYQDWDGRPNVIVSMTAEADFYRLSYRDGVSFVTDRDGRRIWVESSRFSIRYVTTYLVGPVIGFALRLHGIISLHASAVVIDGKAAAFVGAPGMGKSTTAALFAYHRHEVISDDILPLKEKGESFVAVPAYPRLRLWPKSVEFLYGAADALPHISEEWEKREAAVEDRFPTEEVPLGVVYVLNRPRAGGRAAAGAIDAKDALIELVGNTYVNYLLDTEMRATEFALLTRLLSRVPVRVLTVPDGAEYVHGAYEAVLNDVKALVSQANVGVASV